MTDEHRRAIIKALELYIPAAAAIETEHELDVLKEAVSILQSEIKPQQDPNDTL